MPIITSLSIHGFRGFSEARIFRPAIPDGTTPGSGFTILVGPNNAGKSSVTEALMAITQNSTPSFHVGQRNGAANNRVRIEIETDNGDRRTLRTVDAGGATTQFDGNIPGLRAYCVPSRRQFASAFGQSEQTRDDYSNSVQLQASRQRDVPLPYRLQRIAKIATEKEQFDATLKDLMGYKPDWTIEQHETGQYFLRYTVGAQSHSSDGLGDGIIGLFSIAAAIYEPFAGVPLVIDEPELSLHPQFQRRVLAKLVTLSSSAQIIIATHSPLFISWSAIANGAGVVRVVRENSGIALHALTATTRTKIRGFLTDQSNPHVLGLDASEAFFYEDGIVLVEGQEDVVLLPEAAKQAGVELSFPLFGWGVGGADKMAVVAALLEDLGFKRVVGILDADKVAVRDQLAADFANYAFFTLPADDIRTKEARTIPAKDGLLDAARTIRPNLVQPFAQLIANVNTRLAS